MTAEQLLRSIDNLCKEGLTIEVHPIDPLNPQCGWEASIEGFSGRVYGQDSQISPTDALVNLFTKPNKFSTSSSLIKITEYPTNLKG